MFTHSLAFVNKPLLRHHKYSSVSPGHDTCEAVSVRARRYEHAGGDTPEQETLVFHGLQTDACVDDRQTRQNRGCVGVEAKRSERIGRGREGDREERVVRDWVRERWREW